MEVVNIGLCLAIGISTLCVTIWLALQDERETSGMADRHFEEIEFGTSDLRASGPADQRSTGSADRFAESMWRINLGLEWIWFDSRTSTLVLTRRGPEVAQAVQCVDLPGNRDGHGETCLCDLQFRGQSIYRINLTEELAEAAAHSLVAPYLQGNVSASAAGDDAGGDSVASQGAPFLAVHEIVPLTMDEKRMVLREVQETGHAADLRKGFPTREKCEVLLAWMCAGA